MLDGQSAKVAQVHKSGSPGIDVCQPGESLIQCQQVLGNLRGGDLIRFESLGGAAAAAFLSMFAAGVLDEDAAHRFGRGGDEVPPIVPVRFVLRADQAQVGLVDQGGGLQRLPGGLVGHLVVGELAQLLVDEGQQLLRGRRIALLDGVQDLRDLTHECNYSPRRKEHQDPADAPSCPVEDRMHLLKEKNGTVRVGMIPPMRTIVLYVALLAGVVMGFILIDACGMNLTAPEPTASAAQETRSDQAHGALIHVLLTLTAVVALGWFLGALLRHLGQPPVIGEVLAGIVLGPSVLGQISPEAADLLHVPDRSPDRGSPFDLARPDARGDGVDLRRLTFIRPGD